LPIPHPQPFSQGEKGAIFYDLPSPSGRGQGEGLIKEGFSVLQQPQGPGDSVAISFLANSIEE